MNARFTSDRWDIAALFIAVGVVVCAWLIKLKTFHDLGYSSDLFVSVQLARSWMEGRGLLVDNCFGNTLATHTYFSLLPLGLIAKPFGAPGLLFVLAVSIGVAYFFATRVLRILGVVGPASIIIPAVLLASPLTISFYQESHFGFHVEVLAPALCLILFYFLLQQRVIASIIAAIAVVSVKEDAPIAAAVVAIVAGIETWCSSNKRLNVAAISTLVLAVAAFPILLAISAAQPATTYALHSVDRLGIVAPGSLSGPVGLANFVASNVTAWLGSGVVRQWLWIMLVGSFGTILIRPHFLVVGVVTTLVAWLRGPNELLWAPRFYPTEALLWCVTLIASAAIVRAASSQRPNVRGVVIGVAILILSASAFAQRALVKAGNAYTRQSGPRYSAADRRKADFVFERYRREAKADDPVVASPMLFRYAHDRNLFWLDRLYGRPAPIWILSDGRPDFGYGQLHLEDGVLLDRENRPMLRPNDYTVVESRGRFELLRRTASP